MFSRSVAARHARHHREGGQHDRHRAAQPGPGHERLLAARGPGTATRQASTDERAGPGAAGPAPIDAARAGARRAARSGSTSRPEHDEQADLRQPAGALGEGPGGRAGAAAPRCRGRARPGRRRGSRWRAPPRPRRTRCTPRPSVASGYSPAGGQRDAAQRGHRPASPTARPTAAPTTQLVDDLRHRSWRQVGRRRRRAEDQHQDDGGRVVEPGLGLQQPGQPPGQRQRAQDREDRGRVGGGHDRAEEQRQLPVHAEQQVRAGGGDHDADRHPDGGQQRRRAPAAVRRSLQRVVRPPSIEDEGQRGRCRASWASWASSKSQAEPVLAEQHADAEEQQQAGQTQPAAVRAAAMLASSTSPPASRITYSCGNVIVTTPPRAHAK